MHTNRFSKMFTSIHKICILAFLIASVLVFGDANSGFSELQLLATPTTPTTQTTQSQVTLTASSAQIQTASPYITQSVAASPTEAEAVVAASASLSSPSSSALHQHDPVVTTPTAVPKIVTTTTTTTTTLASSNAPATITDDLVARETIQTESRTPQQHDDDEVAMRIVTRTVAAAPPPPPPVATTTTGTYNVEVALSTATREIKISNIASTESKSFVDVTNHDNGNNGNEGINNNNNNNKQIKNAKQQRQKSSWDGTTTTAATPTSLHRKVDKMTAEEEEEEMQLNSKALNEHEIMPTPSKALATPTSTSAPPLQRRDQLGAKTATTTFLWPAIVKLKENQQLNEKQYHEDDNVGDEHSKRDLKEVLNKIPKPIATTASHHAVVHVERKLENGLYRIKLAEIITDEFNGEMPNEQTVGEVQIPTTQTTTMQTKPEQEPTDKEAIVAAVATTSMDPLNVYNNSLLEHPQRTQEPSSSSAYGKLNIVDLYPMKMEDFNPIIRDSNAKLLKERTIFKASDAQDKMVMMMMMTNRIKGNEENENEYGQNLLPNEVEMQQQQQQQQPQSELEKDLLGVEMQGNEKVKTKMQQHHIALNHWNSNLQQQQQQQQRNSISDFTGKLLAEQDGVITEIEQKFRLNEFVVTETTPTTNAITAAAPTSNASKVGNSSSSSSPQPSPSPSPSPSSSSSQSNLLAKRAKSSLIVNQQLRTANDGAGIHGYDFIDRRVKKSFDFPMYRAASDAMSVPHIDFANTKFSADTHGLPPSPRSSATVHHQPLTNLDGKVHNAATGAAAAADGVAATHPEFSTTKFYNSKELYNEMLLQHKKQKQMKASEMAATNYSAHSMLAGGASAASRYMVVPQSSKLKSSTEQLKDSMVVAGATSASTTSAPIKQMTLRATTTTTTASTRTTTTTTTVAEPSSATQAETTATSAEVASKTRKYQKELKRAKLLLKAFLPNTTGTTAMATSTGKPPATAMTSRSTAVNEDSNANDGKKTTQTTTTTARAIKADTAASVISTNASTLSSFSRNTATDYISSKSHPTKTSSIPAALTESVTVLATAAATATDEATSSAFIVSASSYSANSKNNNTPHTTSRTTIKRGSTTSFPSATSNGVATTLALDTTTAHAPLLSSHQQRVTNPTKATSKPIARPRILSRLQEKINSLECEMQNVPQESHLWRGNETHELLLPIMSPENCKNGQDCSPLVISWEGEAEIQSGDILIVEINDSLLNSNDKNNTNVAHTTQVYQVTRSGHEHCDVTEGILLDITPLVVDGRKLVTLYDKDLTEGVNLLIVVSELWGSQCVRLKVTTKTDNCGENADCSGKGVCYSNAAMEEYECQCCSGFAGPHCEEIDACTPSPCTNNGICVDLSQGHEGNSYQCLCPYGYTGKNCQYESDPCNSAECMNGGTCVGNSTHFRCDCTPSFTGTLCQHSLNECESSPCVHGICVDQEDGFRCFCQPGFAGELCNFEYNECESNPCQNGGECIDHIGSFECRCTKGYTGTRCQIKVDFCANKPCPEGHRCIDRGNDFNCECPGGRNGPDCNQMPRAQCNVNPCTHGGTCWSSGESFYCACRPGYTGTMCEDEFVVETVVSSSEFMVDDTSARNFNDKTFGSSVVLKSPIEMHNAYFAAGVLAAAIFIVAIVVTICHCKVNQTYRKFSTRTTTFFPILGFGRRPKAQNKLNKHWLSGKGLGSSGNPLRSSTSSTSLTRGYLPANNNQQYATANSTCHSNSNNNNNSSSQHLVGGQLHERPFQRHLAMNLENDMYYTVDFSESSQHSPLIQ